MLVCYKIEKGKGSEDASGYNIVKGITEKVPNLTLVSRPNHLAPLKNDPAFSGVNFISVELPYLLRFYKRGSRGLIPYYYLWQIFVGLRVKALQKKTHFNVVHHLNFHTDTIPHFLSAPNGKLIWGPIAHHKRVPSPFIHVKRVKNNILEWAKLIVKHIFWRFDPFLRLALSKTDTIFYANKDLALPFTRHIDRIKYQPYAGSNLKFNSIPMITDDFNILVVGRLVHLKGFVVALDAFSKFMSNTGNEKKITLTLVGSGELGEFLLERIQHLHLDGNVKVVNWVDQEQLGQYYRNAHIFLYPSFEAQGLVVSEAMAAGLPVICLAGTGPAFLVGETGDVVNIDSYQKVVDELTDRLQIIYTEYLQSNVNDKYINRCRKSQERYLHTLDWNVIVDNILDEYAAA